VIGAVRTMEYEHGDIKKSSSENYGEILVSIEVSCWVFLPENFGEA
jgi:hypothetical protein